MVDSLHANTQQLICEIERKDQRFRLLQTISIAFLVIGIILLLLLNYAIQTQNRTLLNRLSVTGQQIKAIGNQDNQLLKLNNDNTDSIHAQINCVLQFFSQNPSIRTNSSITQSQPCIVTTSTSGGSAGSTKSR